MLLSTSLSRNKKETNYSLRLFNFLTLKSSNSDVASISDLNDLFLKKSFLVWRGDTGLCCKDFKDMKARRWVWISKVNARTILTPECQGTFPMTHLIRIFFIDKRKMWHKSYIVDLVSYNIKERANFSMYGRNLISVEIRPRLCRWKRQFKYHLCQD